MRVRKFESNVTFQFSTISKMMDQNALELLKNTPLNLTGYRMMRTIEPFEAILIADLSRHMISDNAQISRTATDLGKRGLVAFDADMKNKRRKMVTLTSLGEDLLRSLEPRFTKRRQDVAECLGDELRAKMCEAFARLTEHFTT